MLSAAASEDRRRPAPLRRAAALLALLAGAVTLGVAIVLVVGHLAAGLITIAGLWLATALAWQGALSSGRWRVALRVAAAAVIVAVLVALATENLVVELVVVLVGVVVSAVAIRTAFGKWGSAGGNWRSVPAPERPVLLINPRSGDGRAERVGLAREARGRGVEAVVLGPGDDLAALARDAIARGADCLGMAGGDGSQALVAAIASEHELPFVCIPAGTRNHFALDLGVRRDDVVGALDAFTDGVEATVDLATVNERVFVNNASVGVYGEAVSDPGYRNAKLRTLGRTARTVLAPGARASGVTVVDDAGVEHRSPAVVLISNNPYAHDRALGRSTRPRIDLGTLGIVLLGSTPAERRSWQSPDLRVDAPGAAAIAVDGESMSLEPPLAFASRPRSLRVRISAEHPGVSPSGLLPPRFRVIVPRLLRLAAGS